jgi:NADH:ubiquinone reductase (H+-translocating)
MNAPKTIVIAGGGYGGVSALLEIQKEITKGTIKDVKVVVVDRKDYLLYYPSLHELATSEEEFVSPSEFKKTLALSYSKILPRNVEFIQGEVEKVDQSSKEITVSGETISFDYLVLALGSVTDYFGIEGLKENSYPLKTVKDALKIRNQLEFLIQNHRMDVKKKVIRIAVGGGGFVGVEFTAELLNLVNILAWKYPYPREKIEVCLIEGANRLLPGMSEKISRKILDRLNSFGVNVLLNSFVSKATSSQITFANGEVMNHDLFIWTGGVRSASIPFVTDVEVDRRGRCAVNQYLMLKDKNNGIFVIGDNACVTNKQGIPVPQTATHAIDQGKYVGYALAELLKGNRQLVPYSNKDFAFIIPVHGKWAAMYLPSGLTFFGYLVWWVRHIVDLRYFLKLMPLRQAIDTAWRETKLHSRND